MQYADRSRFQSSLMCLLARKAYIRGALDRQEEIEGWLTARADACVAPGFSKVYSEGALRGAASDLHNSVVVGAPCVVH